MFKDYLNKIKKKYNINYCLEHTLENLLTRFIKEKIKKPLIVIQKPKREKFEAPDFKIINKTNGIIGYLECKDINSNYINSNYINFI